MSIFFISIIASNARLAAAGSGSVIALVSLPCGCESPSPLQRVVIAADSGNGVSVALDTARHTFINPDLTVYLHRPPAGEWVCLDAATTVEDRGTELATCTLYDEGGPIGRSLQSVLIAER